MHTSLQHIPYALLPAHSLTAVTQQHHPNGAGGKNGLLSMVVFIISEPETLVLLFLFSTPGMNIFLPPQLQHKLVLLPMVQIRLS